MKLYLDASALVDVAVQEHAFEAVVRLWDESASVLASRLTYIEAHAALAARARASVGGRREFRRARVELEDRWDDIAVVELDDYVADVAALAAQRYALRGADALHLASAAIVGSPITMVSRDSRLRQAALAAGMDVAP